MRELFVYYKVRDADAEAARRAARTMQDELRRTHAGLVARLLTRAGDGDGLQTWMEIYSLAGAAGIDPRFEAEIERQATSWAALVAGLRHVEAFDSAPPG